MRSSVLCLAGVLALCLVLPLCSARPGVVCVKKQSAQSAKASSSAAQSLSEHVIKRAGCGCGCGRKGASVIACKKKSAKSAASSAASSSSSYEAKKISGIPCIGLKTRPTQIIAKCGCGLLTEVQIKEKYAQQKGESLDAYFKRIVARQSWTKTTEAYVKTLSLVWKDFSSLDLWYNKQYISLVKDFYTNYYAKLESESVEAYYSRIVKKEAWETDDLFARRITIVRDCFPTLDLWVSEKWFDKYTRSLYALEFKKFAKESEADYIKRIFDRDTFFDLSDDIWAKKIFLIQEATISSCDLWYNEAYLSYFKSFYQIWYKKQEKETADAWLIRALSLLPNESEENALKRIKIIKEVTGDCGFWKLEYFKKIQQAKCFKNEWLVKVQKTFFPCGCGAATVERSASSKSSAASASSSAESSEYSTVVKA